MSASFIFLEYDFEDALCTSNKILINFNFAPIFDFPKSTAESVGMLFVNQSASLANYQVADCNLLKKQSSRVWTIVPHKILRKNPDPEYYNKEVKRLKAKVGRVYNKRKLG